MGYRSEKQTNTKQERVVIPEEGIDYTIVWPTEMNWPEDVSKECQCQSLLNGHHPDCNWSKK